MATSQHDDNERDRIERSLDKAFEQESRYRAPHYWRSRERMALKLAMVGTEEEARIARGLPPRRASVIPVEPAWRPSDENGGAP
jgi:hypothetical protein